jgi:glyceraldehyde 3-phosphate dehydrogenase
MNENGLSLRKDVDLALQNWREDEKKALELIKMVGELRFDKSVEIILFRRNIYDSRPSEVINNHLFAANYVQHPITVDISLALVAGLLKLNLPPSRIDIGKLAVDWIQSGKQYADMETFLRTFMADIIDRKDFHVQPKDVVLYGFGRIGRLAARIIIGHTGRGEQLRLKAIVVRPSKLPRHEDMNKRASLLRKDSVHGKFRGTIDIDEATDELIINGNRVKMIFAAKPSDIDYTEYGINDALLIDNTGVWRDKDGLSQHLRPGITQVLFTAPGKGIPNIVYGVNHETVDIEKERILCAASCTTNAIAPILKAVEESLGIERGHMETVHSYTSDQNLLDNFHDKHRRGRAAALNMVITSSGADSAIGKVIPELAGKLTGNAIRVPTPNVSLAVLSLQLKKTTTLDEANEIIKQASLHGELVEQINYSTSNDMVSTDVVGASASSVFDAPSTKVSADGKSVVMYVWYDNEYGYTCQVVRLAKHIAKVRRLMYY